MSGYGMPAHWQASVKRTFTLAEGRPGTGSSKTPLQLLDGTLTPNGLHFERHHNGVPDIDPSSHELVIHGLVKQPRAFTLESLLRYPLESHIRFIECTGNSAANSQEKPPKLDAGALHGLLSCSEWTGVRLSYLLDEVGLEGRAKWLIAEGADAAALSRSVPVEKALDDAMVALFQNGEAIRPEQGYPMRLLLPGFEGNINVKWLRRLKATTMPAHTKDETSKYSDLMPDGRARQFTLEVGVKSVILRPSPGLVMRGPGFYEISGIAWSGAGSIKRVQVSADGGRTWADAALNAPVLPKALTRFRIPWRWEGQPVTLMSRAIDDRRNVQPSRREWTAQYAPGQPYHYNALQSWAIDTSGKVTNVFV
jgi:sulfane dehydrogenase subunit SoxC